jgi:uncharacterized protein YjbI with pentapeptide repeats
MKISLLEHCDLRGATLERCTLSRVRVCDLRGANLVDVDVEDAVGWLLDDASVTRGVLRHVLLASMRRARLTDVRLEQARDADLGDTILQGCDLSGADLRGASLRGARFRSTELLGARVADADFRGVRGLDRASRTRLLYQGARFGAIAWNDLLRRLAPRADLLVLHRTASLLGALSWLLALLVLVTTSVSVWRQASVLPGTTPSLSGFRQASPAEVEMAREELTRFREALRGARDAVMAMGGPPDSWPSFKDVRQNRYDVDGRSQGEVRAELLRGGLPENPLSEATGVVVLDCADEPTQEGLARPDTDWHYCDMNGRLLASAGRTGMPTLHW